jgi:RNA polymerase sigma factor (sigma-70 family)
MTFRRGEEVTKRSTAAVLGELTALFADGSASGFSDGQLLSRFIALRDEGAEIAFRALVVRHGPMVVGVCRRYLDDSNDIDDAFQATFLILARKARSVRVDGSLGRWLHGVSRKVAARSRRVALRRRVRERTLAEQLLPVSADDHERRDLRRVLDEELGRIPEKFRAAVILCDVDGLTYEEAAARLNCPAGTVKSRLSRARARLRSRLARRGIAPGAVMPPAVAIHPSIVNATARAAAVWTGRLAGTTGAASAPIAALTRGVLRSMILSQLKLCVAGLIGAGGLAWVCSATRGENERISYPVQATPEATVPAAVEVRALNPAGPGVLPSQMMKPAVRVRIKKNGANTYFGVGSGTVIVSHGGDAIVLSCAHIFKRIIPAAQFDGYIVVDFPYEREPQPGSDAPQRYMARLIDCDESRDVALLRFHADRDLAFSQIVKRDWRPAAGDPMYAVGCDLGGALRLWSTNILRPRAKITSPSNLEGVLGSSEKIECLRVPEQGRSGGGLFTSDGQLAGVCNYANPAGDTGLYAPPDAIYAILERQGLIRLASDQRSEKARPQQGTSTGIIEPVTRLFVDEYHRLLDDAREAFNRGELTEYKFAISDVSARLDLRIGEMRAELNKLEVKRADLRGSPDEIFMRFFGRASGGARPQRDSAAPAVTRARRSGIDSIHSGIAVDEVPEAVKLRELERKLDRVLTELEQLKASQDRAAGK